MRTTSEAETRGVHVEVRSEYVSERSRPALSEYFFVYTICISNRGEDTVKLISRRWLITDAEGNCEEVEGPGVVGEQPVLRSGESFEYTSACPLPTPFGSMRGTYQMVGEGGERFDAEIAPFELTWPQAIH